MLLLFLALVASSPPPVVPRPEKLPIFSGADYPLEAVQNHWEGSVIAELTISPQGRVINCRIARSSGHQVLDDATCNALVSRAVFKPKLDASGNPTTDTFRTPPVDWRLTR